MLRSSRGPTPVVLAAMLLLAVPAARAQSAPPPPEVVAAARALGVEGIKLAVAGNCAAAMDKLKRAEQLYHAPTTLARLGECQIQLGKLVAGSETLNRVVRETLPDGAPEAFVQAQERARELLEEFRPKIPQLTVVAAPENVDAKILVDQVPMPSALLGVARPIDPGTHQLSASAPGYLTARLSVQIAAGGKQRVELRLVPAPAAAMPPGAPAAGPPQYAPQSSSPMPGPDGPAPVPPNSEFYPSYAAAAKAPDLRIESDSSARQGPDRTAAYVLLGVGAAGVATGALFGALALSSRSNLESGCTGNQCPYSESDTLDRAKSRALISTVGFGVGLAAATTGLILLLTEEDGTHESRGAGSSLAAWVGPGSAGLRGRMW